MKTRFFQLIELVKKILQKKLVFSFLLIFILLGILSIMMILLPLKNLYNSTIQLKEEISQAKIAALNKDIPLLKERIRISNEILAKTENNLQKFSWTRFLPVIKNYYADGQRGIVAGKASLRATEIFIKAIEPYQDFLGIGKREGTGEKTSQERINFLVKTIIEVNSHLDEVENNLNVVKENINQIDATRYPPKIKGVLIREKIIEIQNLISEVDQFFSQGRPLIQKADWLLGKDNPRYYLFIFQNDGELRPTGGFWTAYGILKVDNGQVTPVVSDDIYNLDKKFGNRLPAPRPIKEYHKNIDYWHLRDMNLSPDFSVSLETFLENYKKVRQDQIDGVFAIDTQVLVSVLNVIGGIGVPGWGNFKPDPDNRCFGCPQAIYQLEMLADKPRAGIIENRKGFLAPLMHSLIANCLGSPKEKIAPLVQVLWQNLEEKHILIYFPDPELENSVVTLGIGGKLENSTKDYFHLNDANFGGAKSNLFIEYNIEERYQKKGEKIIKFVNVEYKNPAPPSNCNLEKGELCLNGIYRNWFRFYVPKGSQLIKMTGSEVDPVIYEELDKTVFEGFFGDKNPLYPQSKLTISVEYELPFTGNHFMLFFQKQPGKKQISHKIFVDNELVQENTIRKDTKIVIAL